MSAAVTLGAQCDQVAELVVSERAAKSYVVNLKFTAASALLSTSNRLVREPSGGVLDRIQNPALSSDALAGVNSRAFSHRREEFSLLGGREKVEKPTNQIRERLGIRIFQTGSRQEVGANHLQAILAGFLLNVHQECKNNAYLLAGDGR